MGFRGLKNPPFSFEKHENGHLWVYTLQNNSKVCPEFLSDCCRLPQCPGSKEITMHYFFWDALYLHCHTAVTSNTVSRIDVTNPSGQRRLKYLLAFVLRGISQMTTVFSDSVLETQLSVFRISGQISAAVWHFSPRYFCQVYQETKH